MVKKYIKKAAKKGVKILKKKGGYSYTAKPKPKSKVKSTDTKIKEMQKEIRAINRKRKLMKRLGLEEYLTGVNLQDMHLIKKRVNINLNLSSLNLNLNLKLNLLILKQKKCKRLSIF